MKIAICDDELSIIQNITAYLHEYSAEKHIDFELCTFSSGQELLECNEKFNIAILDVEMPEIDGIELGKKLREKNKNIILIYITAYRKYLDAALDLNAARFFEKPIDKKRFFEGIDNSIKRINNSTISFLVKDNSETVRISTDEIIYIEIEPLGHRKTKIITENKTYVSTNKMSFWENELKDFMFAKTHKSFIVNLNFVTKYDDKNIKLNKTFNIPLSRNYKSNFKTRFAKFMMEI